MGQQPARSTTGRLGRLVGGLVVALVLALVAAPAAHAYEPKPGGIFNDPDFSSFREKWRLMQHVDKAINRSRRGSEILISTYLLDRKQSVNALIRARNRGVHVQVVMDAGINSHQADRLMRALNRDNGRLVNGKRVRGGPDRSYAMKCKGSCRAKGGNNHTKFFAFSHTGTARNVVMVSSANLNKGGALKGFNDLFTMVDRPVVYNHYALIHDEMADDTASDGDSYRVFHDGRFTSRFFPMKRASRANDPVMNDLAKVRCRAARNTPDRRTRIDVAMFAWGDTRGEYIARRLVNLARDGCRVNLIYGAPSKPIAAYLKKRARSMASLSLWDSRHDRNNDGFSEIRCHAKYMLIRGRFAGKSSAFQVFTGSQNWGHGSLGRGDELQLGIASIPAWYDYHRNWLEIMRNSERKG